jgi:hypothetical protein
MNDLRRGIFLPALVVGRRFSVVALVAAGAVAFLVCPYVARAQSGDARPDERSAVQHAINPPADESHPGGLDRTGTLWAPYIEWALTNPTHAGNPFDLEAWVTFTHSDTGRTHRTQMFHDGGDTWKFRFTGTRTGKWNFITESADPDLNGHRGAVTIDPNPDPVITGFLTSRGNKFALQTGEDELRGHLFHVFMNLRDFPVQPDQAWRYDSPGSERYYDPDTSGLSILADADLVQAYLDDTRNYGFDTIYVQVSNNWFRLGAERGTDHDSVNPDPETFRILEDVITTAHRQGMRVHLWAWGCHSVDDWTPARVEGGINGPADRRVQRYIAARLAPLPGWTMNYGFDLHRCLTVPQLDAWAEYLHRHMGWPHLLATRSYAPPNVNIVSYSSAERPDEDVSTSIYGPRGYDETVGHIDSDLDRPHFYEERLTYQRWDGVDMNGTPCKLWEMDGTRRQLWNMTMAGGVGGWWGYFWPRFTPETYPNPEQFRTHREFWAGRFLFDMQRDNALSDDAEARVLRSEAGHLVFYRVDSEAIHLDLSGMSGPQPAVAVDTRKEYQELDLGSLDPRGHTIRLPHRSDWAIAVGSFNDRP